MAAKGSLGLGFWIHPLNNEPETMDSKGLAAVVLSSSRGVVEQLWKSICFLLPTPLY